MHVALSRDLAEDDFVRWDDLALTCEASGSASVGLLLEQLCLELLLQLGDLQLAALDLVPVLGLLVLDLSHLLDEIVSLLDKLGDFRFVLAILRLGLILEVYDLLRERFDLVLGALELDVEVLSCCLGLVDLVSEVISRVDIGDALPEHIVD